MNQSPPNAIATTQVKGRVLLLEDDDTLAGLLARVLRTDGYQVDIFESGESLPTGPKLGTYDVVLTDVHLSGKATGHDVLKRVREVSPNMPVILMTAYADIEGAMNAVSQGAYDYLAKPIEPTELRRMLTEAIARRKLSESKKPVTDARETAASEAQIVGSAPAMIDVYKTVAQVAPTTASVLIVGESGTGKELVARAIHAKSPRSTKPFVAVNCAALPESILESELFGHEKGAFTGALCARAGRLEEADGGTLFLDEIGDFSPAIQVKLLRMLQEREFERVGSNKTLQADVRVIAATNRDLESRLSEGLFRQDLYYRVNVFPISLPPLRERRGDILLLADHFVAKYGKKMGKEVRRISTPAINMMLAYHWPGNVRELENCIEYAVLLSSDGVIQGHHLPPTLQLPASGESVRRGMLRVRVDLLERDMIADALKSRQGSVTLAAQELGITPRMVRYKIKKLGIDYRQFRHNAQIARSIPASSCRRHAIAAVRRRGAVESAH